MHKCIAKLVQAALVQAALVQAALVQAALVQGLPATPTSSHLCSTCSISSPPSAGLLPSVGSAATALSLALSSPPARVQPPTAALRFELPCCWRALTSHSMAAWYVCSGVQGGSTVLGGTDRRARPWACTVFRLHLPQRWVR